MLTGCIDEIQPGGEDCNQTFGGPEVYFSVQFKPTTQTGSRADDFEASGTEIGIDVENKINNVRMIIVEKVEDDTSDYTDENGDKVEYRTVAYSDITKSSDIVNNGTEVTPSDTWTVTGTFLQDQLLKYFEDKGTTTPDLYIVLAANFNSNSHLGRPEVGKDIQKAITSPAGDISSLYLKGNVTEANNDFLMLSKEPYSVNSLTKTTVVNSTNKTIPTTLTTTDDPINVQRLAARIDIDFKHLKFAFPAGTYDESKLAEDSEVCYWVPVSTTQGEDAETLEFDSSLPDETAYVLQIEDIALINMSKDYYLYQMAGNETNGWQIFGKETTKNYFADPLSAQKISTADGNQFFQPLSEINGPNKTFGNSFTYLPVNSFASPAARTKRNILNKTAVVDNKDYAIFHYALPNSVHDETKQFKKNGTAVIFKARITDGNVVVEGKDPIIRNAEESGDDIYAIGNKIFGTLDYFTPKENTSESDEDYGIYKNLFDSFVNEIDVMIIHLDEEINVLKAQLGRETDENKELEIQAQIAKKEEEKNYYESTVLPKLTYSSNEDKVIDGETIPVPVRKNKYTYKLNLLFNDSQVSDVYKPYLTHLKELWDSNFKIYKAENVGTDEHPEWAYYCYYFYWIRHNNNSKGSVMGPMEFAIVRNHIYKLSIKGIYELGYPDDPGDDPDPLDPNDEIESAKTRIDVQTTLLPWGLRKDQGAIIN